MRRFLRYFLFFAVLGGIAIGVGGYFMRGYIVKLVRNRAITATSVVFSSPFAIAKGMNIADVRLVARLTRAGYTRVDTEPKEPGEYSLSQERLAIFLRGSPEKNEKSRLVAFFLNGKTIAKIAEPGTAAAPAVIWLDPEPLTFLGTSSTRVSEPKTLTSFPSALVEALLAVEDERFYKHFGIDPIAVLRAIFINLHSGRVSQGASTLTQQLAKNLLLTRERTIGRKVLEAFSAILLETAFSKEKILELYLNEVFLGQEGAYAIHGFGEGAKSFFGKDVEKLSLAEAATLAGLVKAPTKYSPRRNPELAKERRRLVLAKMQELGYITKAEETVSADVDLKVVPPLRSQRIAPYFVDYLRKQLDPEIQKLEEGKDSFHVFTTLDREYQECAEQALHGGLRKLETQFAKVRRKTQPLQAALVSVLPTSGEIRAWVGGRDYGRNQFDRVSQALRQPGSSFKPFVYLTALDKSLNHYRVARTTNLLEDEPVTFELPGSGPWTPENYEHDYRGEVTVREALVHSLNIPTIHLALKVGIDSIKNTAALFGFGDNLPAVPSIALGAGEVSPLALARAYAAIANGGMLLDLRPITNVTLNGKLLRNAVPVQGEQRAASEPAVYVLTNILQDVVNRGTARSIRSLGYEGAVAGKTGTTNDARDAWFAGFTPHLLTVVWVGFDDNSKLGLTGGQAAAPIWAEYMKCLGSMEPEVDFIVPPGVVTRQIDRASGLLATEYCPSGNIVNEVFVEGTEPVTPCQHESGPDVYPDPSDRPSGGEWNPPPRSGQRPPSLWDRIFGH